MVPVRGTDCQGFFQSVSGGAVPSWWYGHRAKLVVWTPRTMCFLPGRRWLDSQARGRNGGGCAQHFPPPFCKGKGEVCPYTQRQGGRIRPSTHSECLGKSTTKLAVRWSQTPSGVHTEWAEVPTGRMAEPLTLRILGTLGLTSCRRPSLTHRRRGGRAEWVRDGNIDSQGAGCHCPE